MKEKKYWNGWIKIFFEAMAYFFVFIAGLGGCILVTAFLGLIRVGSDNRYAQLIKHINIDSRMNQIWMII